MIKAMKKYVIPMLWIIEPFDYSEALCEVGVSDTEYNDDPILAPRRPMEEDVTPQSGPNFWGTQDSEE